MVRRNTYRFSSQYASFLYKVKNMLPPRLLLPYFFLIHYLGNTIEGKDPLLQNVFACMYSLVLEIFSSLLLVRMISSISTMTTTLALHLLINSHLTETIIAKHDLIQLMKPIPWVADHKLLSSTYTLEHSSCCSKPRLFYINYFSQVPIC